MRIFSWRANLLAADDTPVMATYDGLDCWYQVGKKIEDMTRRVVELVLSWSLFCCLVSFGERVGKDVDCLATRWFPLDNDY
jgi:hypothetical protein